MRKRLWWLASVRARCGAVCLTVNPENLDYQRGLAGAYSKLGLAQEWVGDYERSLRLPACHWKFSRSCSPSTRSFPTISTN